jgi:hypothetical protein
MKGFRTIAFVFMFSLCVIPASFALRGVIASPDDMSRLKADLKYGRFQVGITRLEEVIDQYGEPIKKTDAERKVTLDYGDFKIEFNKDHFWRDWGYDSFKSPAYTDKIKLLRQKLESKKIEGRNIPIEKFYKDYDEATEIYLTPEDGQISVYYYGDIRLTFENVFTLKLWEAKNLDDSSSGIATSGLQTVESAAPPVAVVTPTPAAPAATKAK